MSGGGRGHPRSGRAAIDVLHICYGGEGGQAAVVQILSRELRKHGLRSAAIALAPSSEMMTEPAVWEDLDFTEFVTIDRRADLRSMLAVERATRRLKPRIIVCHSHRHGPAAVFGQLAAGLVPRMILVEHHSIPLRSTMDNLRSASALLLSRALVLLSEEYARAYPLRQLPLPGQTNTRVIPNGVDVTEFQSRPPDTALRRAKPVVGMVSRFVPSKDHVSLVRAIDRMRAVAGSSLVPELRLAGSGPTWASVQREVERLNLEDHVMLVGHVDPARVPTFYQSLDVYAHSSLGETSSLSLWQAAAAGVPIVATRVEGVVESLHDGKSAILVDAGDVDGMAHAITLALNPGIAEGLRNEALRLVKSEHSSTRMARDYLALFSKIDAKGSWLAES